MPGLLSSFANGRTVLVAVAAPLEAAAVRKGLGLATPRGESPAAIDWPVADLAPGVQLIETGVGKVNAAAAIACRTDPALHAVVLNLGICGTLLPLKQLPLASVVLADASIYADEGVDTPEGFQSLPQMGFPLGPFKGEAIPADKRLVEQLTGCADATGPIATVSTCSGTDKLAAEVARRTGAIAEAMEGAAIAHVLFRLHPAVLFAELRVVSNSTGDRPNQQWDIRGALERLSSLTTELFGG